ncbi:ArsR/SmtB family transcription factor [Paenibacillus sp. MMS18-CY102]|uniref:ArsR/SmtB family transcription factor n=1 Tax=Paenibacillus sp. MMS18-CY102 TaxID=2682849 RepID=UPI0013652506|nr:metalloregulator ArsR/SmtB family transcription factor [Paenibacillus sp. MMS18-CY102]MWC30990.1 metalloregulator ArsR/SmtB family transcription factor [Paenibacillus sp. MMS18-CY102]
MDAAQLQAQAIKVHRALGEQTRYRIVQLLATEGDLCPAELEKRLESIPLSTLSHHLKQLAECQLLTPQKQGTFIYYSLNRETVQKFAAYLIS